MAIRIIEQCQVSPSQGAAPEQLLPLVYFDMQWLPSPFTEGVFFYNFQFSKSHFLENIIPKLKNSLSLTLKHFLPLAGNIVFPLAPPNKPVAHYVSGDSVSLTIAFSDGDFTHLTGNHSRDTDEFHGLVPQVPPATYSSDAIKFSVFAVQVTLFPDQGICIGYTEHHSICDAADLLDGFITQWASINKFNGDSGLTMRRKLPSYDRSNIQHSKKLDALVWDEIKTCTPTVKLALPLPLHNVRRSFILSEVEIKKLKEFVANRKPGMAGRVSSFMVATGYLWSCLAKSARGVIADDELEYFTSPVDCRARLDPPLPENYFGNCLIFLQAKLSHGKLKGKEGFVAAVEAIGEAIYRSTVRNGSVISDAIQGESEKLKEMVGKRWIKTALSPRFDVYDKDYGWGRPIKYECIHIDFDDGAVSLCKSRDGGIEMGFSMPKLGMEAFAAIFNTNLCVNSRL